MDINSFCAIACIVLGDYGLMRMMILLFLILIPIYFSQHWPSGPMLSISRNVRLCFRLYFCVSVSLFTF